jgi:murein L,D-transpeptidase YafK
VENPSGTDRRLKPFSLSCRLLAAVLMASTACAISAPALYAAQLTDLGPEPLLATTLAAINQGNFPNALQQVDSLIRSYPNFRLAYLIRGDLLLAQTKPLTSFGEGGKSDAGKVADLHAEAVARLQAYNSKPRDNTVPRYLLQLENDQKFAIVVDTKKSRLYLYRNDGGTPRFVADYYVTQGKLGADKVSEGDKRTPIGVYHVTSSLSPHKLGNFYGSGAYPINYPNEWDRRKGRNGHGIWLHGTPPDTFSRPPLASDGCVVLANQDLDAIASDLQIGVTPVIISNSIEWLSLDDWQAERSALIGTIDAWRHDWESRDIDKYAQHYSREFLADGQNFKQWIAQKRKVNVGKTWIKIDARNISMLRNPGKEEYVVVAFEQDYQSNNLSGMVKKRQYWVKEEGNWKIIYEGTL